MNKNTLQKEINEAENLLLMLSEKVNAIRDIDLMSDWIIRVLEKDSLLATYLHFPSQKKIRAALLTIVKHHSPLTHPLVNLLANRISAYIATIEDLYRHSLRGIVLSNLLTNFEPLIKLVATYRNNYEQIKTIPIICAALKGHRLYIYKSSPNEPDLRVALRAFYEDKNRSDQDAIVTILDFVFNQLKQEVKQSGYIAQPRHAWWAVLTVANEANDQWLLSNRIALNKIIDHLISISGIEYSPRADMDFTSIVPELDSPYNEKAWTTINAIRILKSRAVQHLSPKVIKSLKEKIESNIKVFIKLKTADSLKHLQSKLIFLYEALGYYNLIETYEMARQSRLDLRSHTIGSLIYADEVIQSYKPILKSILDFLENPEKLKKPTLGSMLISGSPGQGKTELSLQIVKDLEKISINKSKRFSFVHLAIGTHIKSHEDLILFFQEFNTTVHLDDLKVIIFDEFDKASFDLYTPFLPFLEGTLHPNAPATIWIFAQSSFPNFEAFGAHAQNLQNKAMRDFITRLQLGHIDLPELKVSAQQKIYSTIGIAKGSHSSINKITRSCFLYFSTNEALKNTRDLMSEFARNAIVKDGILTINHELQEQLSYANSAFGNFSGFINLEL